MFLRVVAGSCRAETAKFFSYLQVFHSDDPLDSKDFNPVDYINTLFPTEQVWWVYLLRGWGAVAISKSPTSLFRTCLNVAVKISRIISNRSRSSSDFKTSRGVENTRRSRAFFNDFRGVSKPEEDLLTSVELTSQINQYLARKSWRKLA